MQRLKRGSPKGGKKKKKKSERNEFFPKNNTKKKKKKTKSPTNFRCPQLNSARQTWVKKKKKKSSRIEFCPKTNDIPLRLKSILRNRERWTSCGSPLSDLEEEPIETRRRGTLATRRTVWCIYGTLVRVAVIKRPHFLPLLQSSRLFLLPSPFFVSV